jgi:hypothetical protein
MYFFQKKGIQRIVKLLESQTDIHFLLNYILP